MIAHFRVLDTLHTIVIEAPPGPSHNVMLHAEERLRDELPEVLGVEELPEEIDHLGYWLDERDP